MLAHTLPLVILKKMFAVRFLHFLQLASTQVNSAHSPSLLGDAYSSFDFSLVICPASHPLLSDEFKRSCDYSNYLSF